MEKFACKLWQHQTPVYTEVVDPVYTGSWSTNISLWDINQLVLHHLVSTILYCTPFCGFPESIPSKAMLSKRQKISFIFSYMEYVGFSEGKYTYLFVGSTGTCSGSAVLHPGTVLLSAYHIYSQLQLVLHTKDTTVLNGH